MTITKLKRIADHETVYQQLKILGSTGDSFNDVIKEMLRTMEKLQSDSRDGALNQTVTNKNVCLFSANILPNDNGGIVDV